MTRTMRTMSHNIEIMIVKQMNLLENFLNLLLFESLLQKYQAGLEE